jgi:hypothetical protein
MRFASSVGVDIDRVGIPLFFRCAVAASSAAVATGVVALAQRTSDEQARVSAWLAPMLAWAIVLVMVQAAVAP